MHDRRLNGETLVFGVQGALYQNAMTWWDHSTGSVWSQPIGRALLGDLVGAELRQIPSTLDSWETFRSQHPDGKVMRTGLPPVRPFAQTAREDWVIGVALNGEAAAVDAAHALSAGAVNFTVGAEPVLVWTDRRSRTVRAFLRRVQSRTLTFERDARGQLRDQETGSRWDPLRGLAVEGPLQGQALSAVPWTSSFAWAWQRFYPDTALIG